MFFFFSGPEFAHDSLILDPIGILHVGVTQVEKENSFTLVPPLKKHPSSGPDSLGVFVSSSLLDCRTPFS